MGERNLHQDLTEAERRLSNVVLLGQVAELDAQRARVRVKAGSILTGWLPFTAARAGPDRTWHAPEAGEQVVLVAPGGDLNQAVVVGSIYRSEHPAPADSIEVSRTVFKDGAVREYDRKKHHWRLAVPESGKIVLKAGPSRLELGNKIVLEIGPTRLELSEQGARLTAPRIDLN